MSDCTCGSGAHPRRCEVHPEGFAAHCRELDAETRWQDLEGEIAHLHAKLDRLLSLAGDKGQAAMLAEAVERQAKREAGCTHEAAGGPLSNFCRKCGRQIQAPEPAF